MADEQRRRLDRALTMRPGTLQPHFLWRVAPLVAAILLRPGAAVAGYYCPKGDVSLYSDPAHFVGRAVMAFQLAPDPSPAHEKKFYGPEWGWTMKDCSNKEFSCFDAHDPATGLTRHLFVPRRLEAGKVYRYGAAKAFVAASASASPVPTVQVIDYQKFKGKTVAVKFTLRDGSGAVYIDGLNFWKPLDYQAGETCILESGVGFFSEVRIPKQALGKPSTD
jgi:hypothetical protein